MLRLFGRHTPIGAFPRAVITFMGLITLVFPSSLLSQDNTSLLAPELDRLAEQIESKVIEWRRDIHQHPELGNREFRTAAKVTDSPT